MSLEFLDPIEVTRAQLQASIAAGHITYPQYFKIMDAVGSTMNVLVKCDSAGIVTTECPSYSIELEVFGEYDITADTFTDCDATGVLSVTGTSPITVDNTDPQNPIVEFSGSLDSLIGATSGIVSNPTPGVTNETWLGELAGSSGGSPDYTVFVGLGAGAAATDAIESTFVGRGAGSGATDAANSVFLGTSAGLNAATAANSIFIGINAGSGDTVDNTGGGTSILIGDNSSTGGFEDSIAIGANAINTQSNEFLVDEDYTKWNIRGLPYEMPSTSPDGVLTNTAGVLSWAAGGGGATNLAIGTVNGTTVQITSDTGTDATIPAATATDAGVMIAADKVKSDYITVTQAVDLDALESTVNALDSAVVLKGVWDASAGTFPGGGVAQAGWSYIVSVAGTVDSVAFNINDRIIAILDNASTTTFAANWFKADYTDQVLSVNGLAGAVALTGTANRITVSGANVFDVGTDVYVAGGTDVAVADGGTGASTALGAQANLGIQPQVYQKRHMSVYKNAGATTIVNVGFSTAMGATGTASNVDDATRPWVNYASSGSANAFAGLQGGLNSQYRADWETESVTVMKTDADITNIRYWIGFFNNASPTGTSAPTSQCAAFRYDTGVDGTAFWRCYSYGSTATTTTTAAAIAVSTVYTLRIVFSNTTPDVKFYINGTLVATHTGTSLPTTGGLLQCFTCTALTAAVHNFIFSRNDTFHN